MASELLKQALDAYKTGGQEAVEAWFESLSEEDRDLFISELNVLWNVLADWLGAFHARLANFFWQFGKTLTDRAETMMPAVIEEDIDGGS